MPFWVYMLQCRDRTLYVGHAEDLDVRLAQHQDGTYQGYTTRKRPVTLVWSEAFPTRYEALAAERQIKGWSKDKKLALIRGDWNEISRLAAGKKGRPSTSSGRTEQRNDPFLHHNARPEPVEGRPSFLIPHSAQREPLVARLSASINRTPSGLGFSYRLTGSIEALAIPKGPASGRRDGLWRYTCFEAFLLLADGSYWEFNFSPAGDWAAYIFSDWRKGMAPLDVPAPRLAIRVDHDSLFLDSMVELPALPEKARVSLTAIIEDQSGTKSYWALAHPDGEPDFHHPACFALDLPPPA